MQSFSIIRKILATVVFVTVYVIINGQTIDAVKLADSLFKPGALMAAITTYDFPKEIKRLQEKALSSLKSSSRKGDSSLVFLIKKGDVDIPKLLDDYGLTESEFDKMISGFRKKREPIFSDTTAFKIKKVNGILIFETTKKMHLFNYLSIDTKRDNILFDNLTTTKELQISGKFYAPTLVGIETHTSKIANADKNKSGIVNFGLAIGVNKGDERPSMTLIYGREKLDEIKFISITIM